MTMDQAKLLTKAEHCVVMLVDVEKMELVDKAAPKVPLHCINYIGKK